MNAIIPKFLIEEESVITLRDKGIKLDEGTQTIGKYKIPCYKFYNMSETDVFDEIEGNSLLEADNTKAEKASYSSRVASILFLRIRQANTIKDRDQKIIASCALLSAVNALAEVDIQQAKRFLPLVRGMI